MFQHTACTKLPLLLHCAVADTVSAPHRIRYDGVKLKRPKAQIFSFTSKCFWPSRYFWLYVPRFWLYVPRFFNFFFKYIFASEAWLLIESEKWNFEEVRKLNSN